MSVPVSDRVQLARRMLCLAFNGMGGRTSLEAISDRLYGMRDSEFTPAVAEQVEQEVAEIQERVRLYHEEFVHKQQIRLREIQEDKRVQAYRDLAAHMAELAGHLENAHHNVRGLERQISKNTDVPIGIHLERRVAFERQRVLWITEGPEKKKNSFP